MDISKITLGQIDLNSVTSILLDKSKEVLQIKLDDNIIWPLKKDINIKAVLSTGEETNKVYYNSFSTLSISSDLGSYDPNNKNWNLILPSNCNLINTKLTYDNYTEAETTGQIIITYEDEDYYGKAQLEIKMIGYKAINQPYGERISFKSDTTFNGIEWLKGYGYNPETMALEGDQVYDFATYYDVGEYYVYVVPQEGYYWDTEDPNLHFTSITFVIISEFTETVNAEAYYWSVGEGTEVQYRVTITYNNNYDTIEGSGWLGADITDYWISPLSNQTYKWSMSIPWTPAEYDTMINDITIYPQNY